MYKQMILSLKWNILPVKGEKPIQLYFIVNIRINVIMGTQRKLVNTTQHNGNNGNMLKDFGRKHISFASL